MTGVLRVNSLTTLPGSPWRVIFPSHGKMSTTSFMFRSFTSHSMGSAPLSSMVLKKMGAILFPMHTPLPRLLGTNGTSSPMCHRMELVADFRLDPVPTTSPTYARGKPSFLASSICSKQLSTPGRGILSMARAWTGTSGRLHASGAGDKSSVLVSPGTLNTVTVILSGTLARPLNHSPSAHDAITAFAWAFPAFAFASTS
mmetsp:Transcript_66930/g.134905  ORF Transcript_66930/g.134905 Transcript_66930/m.134905 type:complete len:200 (+) Transcript_66930:1125-1724(+)